MLGPFNDDPSTSFYPFPLSPNSPSFQNDNFVHFSDCLTATLKQKYLFGQPVPCDVMQSNCYHYLLLGQAMRCILFKKLFFQNSGISAAHTHKTFYITLT